MSDQPLIGILGGGQLARMMALAGLPLGLRFRVADPEPEACAGAVAELGSVGYDDREELARFFAGATALTFDFENVPAATAAFLAERFPVRPSPRALAIAQDRLEEKRLFRRLGFATADFAPVATFGDLPAAIAAVGLPALLKTRRLGYDGKGQARLDDPSQAEQAWQAIGAVPALLEAVVPFTSELSLLAVRGADGAVRCYPPVMNWHHRGILAASLAPAPLPRALIERAREMVAALLRDLDYVGVLALELFVREEELIANEIAPRVHNTGHWTIEGAETSQFENHLRAVLGWPLGEVGPRGHALMINFIGRLPDRRAALAVAGLHWHEYGKRARPGRKLGHATLLAEDPGTLAKRLEAAKMLFGEAAIAVAVERVLAAAPGEA
jgi:5-(carboxyamino)imidazole ribonucleotide synthase